MLPEQIYWIKSNKTKLAGSRYGFLGSRVSRTDFGMGVGQGSNRGDWRVICDKINETKKEFCKPMIMSFIWFTNTTM